MTRDIGIVGRLQRTRALGSPDRAENVAMVDAAIAKHHLSLGERRGQCDCVFESAPRAVEGVEIEVGRARRASRFGGAWIVPDESFQQPGGIAMATLTAERMSFGKSGGEGHCPAPTASLKTARSCV